MDYELNQHVDGRRVEPVDTDENSIDNQLVQLAQAKLDRQIDQETYDRLIGLVRELQPTHKWDSAELVQYPRQLSKVSRFDFSVFEKTFIAVCILFLALVLFGIISSATRSVPGAQCACHRKQH